MNTERIAELLAPFLPGPLADAHLQQISTYVDLLMKWNARMNLTAVRDPEQIVTRHFGESLFAAFHLFPDPNRVATLADVGSGAGFPGLPIALVRPQVHVILIEAQGKKATFLKEVVRSLRLENVSVFAGRAETYRGTADVVTFRAVERFEAILPVSAAIAAPGGILAALLGASQVAAAEGILVEKWETKTSVYFPGSGQRVLWAARQR